MEGEAIPIQQEHLEELKSELLNAIENVNDSYDWSYLLCILLFVVIFGVIVFTRKYILTWVAVQTKKTDNAVDDLLIELIQGWLVIFLYVHVFL